MITTTDKLALISEIYKLNPKLNDWERSFLVGISKKKELTIAQEGCLQNMYRRVVGGGQYERRQVFRR